MYQNDFRPARQRGGKQPVGPRYYGMVSGRSPLVQLGVQNKGIGDDDSGPVHVFAGNFSDWLRRTEASLRSEAAGVVVDCGSCRGCCRSSMFIHVRPEEKETIRRIPRALLFPAPGLPIGHLLIGLRR